MALLQDLTKFMFWGVHLYTYACLGGDCGEVDESISLLQISTKPTRHAQSHSFPLAHRRKKRNATVTFGLFTSSLPQYRDRMAAIEETWAKEIRPQQLLIVAGNSSIPNVTSQPTPLCHEKGRYPGILCKQASLIATGFEKKVDWLVVLNDDHYAFPRNWEDLLENYNSRDKVIVGNADCASGQYCEDGKKGLCGGYSYAVSSGAMQAMIGKYKEEPKQSYLAENLIAAAENMSPWGDQTISCVARRSGVLEFHIPAAYQGTGNKHKTLDVWKEYMKSPERKPVSFHYVDPKRMREIHQIWKVAEQARLLGLLAPESTAKSTVNETEPLDPPVPSSNQLVDGDEGDDVIYDFKGHALNW
mmetsp:Transcript_147300/g.274410  ORF Transcript_147300/g.274410 Transcript_147300/m.274410 type:complete len:359 (+) Transcript_147300:46-1122(+)